MDEDGTFFSIQSSWSGGYLFIFIFVYTVLFFILNYYL